MTEKIKIRENWIQNAKVSKNDYALLYDKSINKNEEFWKEQGKRIDWIKPFSKIKDVKYSSKDVVIKWYYDGSLNVSYNCIDRHALNTPDKVAIIWEGDDPKTSKKITYKELLENVCRVANVLKKIGVKKGDRVTIYLTMIPELAYMMLACSRIGAIHSIIFGGFSADSIAGRIQDCKSEYVITADEGIRGGKIISLKQIVDTALKKCPDVKKCLVVKRTGNKVNWVESRDLYLDDEISSVDTICEPEEMSAKDPLFILYTSGSTGKPKGVLHTTGGYLVYTNYTFEQVFDYKKEDIFWCTADIGWITGHSYIVYGPLSNCATSVMFEGVPNYPDYGRFWAVVDKHKINIFYTAPTALRALMKEGNGWVNQHDLSSIRLLGTVGEPIKEPEWMWYHTVVGKENSPIIDTWWQTETGGILITPLPGAIPTKPGSVTYPFFGIEPVLLTEDGQEIEGNDVSGLLAIKASWPGQMRTIYGDHQRFIETYFSQFPGYYFTGDGARRDKDGYYWITGRVDDVLNVSGHRIGTAEVEGEIGKAEGVAEAAVVGYPHDIKGQGIYAYVTLMTGVESDPSIEADIRATVTQGIGPHAKPDKIQFTPALPKTRSGKIMRRILRKIAEGDLDNMGDISTLADPSVVDNLVAGAVSYK